MDKLCKDCLWWTGDKEEIRRRIEKSDGSWMWLVGKCRVNPPSAKPHDGRSECGSEWPVTEAVDWCAVVRSGIECAEPHPAAAKKHEELQEFYEECVNGIVAALGPNN